MLHGIYLNRVHYNEKTDVNLMFITSFSTKHIAPHCAHCSIVYTSDQAPVGITINVLCSIAADGWQEHKLLIGILRMSFHCIGQQSRPLINGGKNVLLHTAINICVAFVTEVEAALQIILDICNIKSLMSLFESASLQKSFEEK